MFPHTESAVPALLHTWAAVNILPWVLHDISDNSFINILAETFHAWRRTIAGNFYLAHKLPCQRGRPKTTIGEGRVALCEPLSCSPLPRFLVRRLGIAWLPYCYSPRLVLDASAWLPCWCLSWLILDMGRPSPPPATADLRVTFYPASYFRK